MPALSRCQLVWYAAASPWPSLLAYRHATTALLADTVKGGELSYTTLAMEREHTACSSLLRLAGAVLADPEPMPPRLIRGCCIALAFTCLRNGTQPHHSLADCMIQYRNSPDPKP